MLDIICWLKVLRTLQTSRYLLGFWESIGSSMLFRGGIEVDLNFVARSVETSSLPIDKVFRLDSAAWHAKRH